MGVTYPTKDDLTKPQSKMLKMLDAWDGDADAMLTERDKGKG